MKKSFYLFGCLLFVLSSLNAGTMKTDTYQTSHGALKVTLLGHASVRFEYAGKVIFVDPYSQITDFSVQPKADLILLTHEHPDHLDALAINQIKKSDTKFVVSQSCRDQLGYGEVMKNGSRQEIFGISIEAVPAYNLVHKRPEGDFFHPKGRGNGYVLTFGGMRVYVAGDTENIPEMSYLKDIKIAFLPKNLPYTMDDVMFLDAVGKVKPKFLYPYHFSEFDQEKLVPLIQKLGTEVILRPMKNK